MKISIAGFLALICFSSFAGDIKYPISSIPEELKNGVDVVIREDLMRFRIISKNHAVFYAHEVITIFNENGNERAKRVIGYNKNEKILSFSGYVYDATGKQIKKLKNSEIYDQSAVDESTLFSDNRIKVANLSQASYPYTIEFEYEVEYKYLYSIPGLWLGSERSSTEKVSYQLIFPADLAPRYKAFKIETSPKKEKLADGSESITWTLENVKPLKFESYGPIRSEQTPHIMAAPSKFEYEGYQGDMSTWKDYGVWQLKVNNGRDQLAESTKAKVKELVKGKTTIEEKTKVMYEFLQNKTRYVNIAEGIGGLQPFPASVVDEMGYGDCKALSNYMVTLLKEAGVKAYYTKIYAGERNREIEIDFPSHQTNHIVVSVPNEKDTIWLECTNQINPFGYQGTFTEDRWAMMVTEEGGKLVRTINYKPEQNIQSRTVEVVMDAAGNAKAKIRTTSTGIQYENDDLNWAISSSEKQKKWIQENTDIPSFSINSFSMNEMKDKIPSVIVNLDLTLNRYASVSGKRLFVTPNLMNRISQMPEKMTERKTDVLRKSNFIDLDTVIFTMPENLYPEFLPQPVKISSRFGEYEVNFSFDAGKVIYTRRLKMWKGRFPKDSYNEMADFYKSISKADNTKLVFLNKT